MRDDEIVAALRRASTGRVPPHEVAELLDEIADGGLTQSSLITYFNDAFPVIPLRVLLKASAWNRVSDGGLSDEDFDRELERWFTGDPDMLCLGIQPTVGYPHRTPTIL